MHNLGAASTSGTSGEKPIISLSSASLEGPPSGRTRRELLALTLLLLLGLALRLYGLGSQSIWIDETQSLSWAKLGIRSIIYEGAHYNQAPLYFILLRAWMGLGPEGEIWARLLSTLLGTAFIGVFYLFVREIAAKPVPLVSAGLLTLSPLAIWHSQDARMYTLMLVCSHVGLLLLLRYLRGGGIVSLIGFCLAIECSLYSHVYMTFLLPVLLLFLWIARREFPFHRTRGAVAVVLFAGAGYLPWIWTVLTASRLEAGFYRPVGVFSLPYALYAFSVGYSLGPSVADLHNHERIGATLREHLPIIILVTILFGVVFLMGLARLKRFCGKLSSLTFLLLVLPLLLPVLVTLISRVTFNARYAIASFPAYLLVLGIGLGSMRSRTLSGFLGGGLAALMVASLVGHYCDPVYAKADSRAAYRLIQARKQLGDCVLVIGVTEAFRHYEGGDVQSRWLDLRSRDRIRAAEESLREWSAECSGLWVVAGRTWESDPFGVIDDLVGRYFRPVEKSYLPGLKIARYHSPNSRVDEARAIVGRE